MSKSRYHRLDGVDCEYQASELEIPCRKSSRLWSTLKLPLTFVCGVLFASAVFVSTQTARFDDVSYLQPSGQVKIQFEYNETYAGPPTMSSELAWLDLMPEGLGVVQHQALSDRIVQVSVFHQLHCLMTIRHALYKDWHEERHSHMEPFHTRHCLDYLRQVIMCNADTNIEKRPAQIGGYNATRELHLSEIPGFGLKQCRNFERVKTWSQDWRAYDGKIPKLMTELHDQESLRGRVIDYDS